MKVAIYTISKNEEKFVNRFMDSAVEADYVVVADTGSSDRTVELLQARGALVSQIAVNPWRFDVARNASLVFVPADVDVCVCIDLDEVLTPGWRAALEKAWTESTTRLRYPYIWNTLADGKPGTTFWYDKIHKRHGYRWVKPVHEILVTNEPEVQTYSDGFTLYHYPDNSKSRGSYLPLLELAVKEEPNDDRSSHYLGREYMYYHKYPEAITELTRHLSLPSAKWQAERAASMRYISRSCFALHQYRDAENWALKACSEAPLEREPWVELGKLYYELQNFHGAYYAMKQALSITEKPMTYICEPQSWGSYPYDIASVAAWQLGCKTEAHDLAREAVRLSPDDTRLVNNFNLIEKSLQ